MNKAVVNVIASIQARLRNRAVKTNKPYTEILQYYGMERFLYRLSKSPYAGDFILKGGLVFYGLGIPLRRPTRDIDFLGNLKDVEGTVKRVMAAIISVQDAEDGITFEPDSLEIIKTQIDADRNGVRTTITARLGRSKIPIQIDIGFSDEITTRAVDIKYPVLLPTMEHPRLMGYPPESMISEKFHAMVRFAQLTSRWKDYYDIWLLSETFRFESRELKRAIVKTFENRSTALPDKRPVALEADFAFANNKKWRAFLRRFGLEKKEINDLGVVVDKIWSFLAGPDEELLLGRNGTKKHWTPGTGWK
jgi:hypothetical protein